MPASAPANPLPPGALTADGQWDFAEYRNGTREQVLVRFVPARVLLEFMADSIDPARVVDRVTGLPVEKVDTLTDDCLYHLYHLGRALNDPRVGRLFSEIKPAVNKVHRDLDLSAAPPPESASPSPSSSTAPSPAPSG